MNTQIFIKVIITQIFILVLTLNSLGQAYTPFPTTNTFWSAMHCEPGPYVLVSGLAKVGVFGDTVINSKTYHKLYLQSEYAYGDFSCDTCGFDFDIDNASYFLSYREENQIIYFVPVDNGFGDPEGTEYPIFDFTISSVGETVTGYQYLFNPYSSQIGFGNLMSVVTLTVESIDSVLMSDDSYRRRITFEPLTYGLQESWIEGIGSTKGFGLSLNVTNNYNSMVCFSHDGINLSTSDIFSEQVCTSHPDLLLTFANRCEYTSGGGTFITLTPDNISVASPASSTTTSLDCPTDMSWSATDGNFSAVSPSSGTGPMTLTINYEENTSTDQRVDIVTLSGSGETADFTLTQSAAVSPTANFSANPLWGIETLTTQFVDESNEGSSPITSWEWTFGDGESSSEQNPNHTYNSSGGYTVSLTVSDGNFVSTETKENYITVYEELIVSAGPDFGLEIGQSIQFDGSYAGGSEDVTILWEGVGNSVTIDNSSILNPNAGPFPMADIYNFKLTVTDNYTGEVNEDNMLVDVIIGLGEYKNSEIKIYPNPTSGIVTVNTQRKLDILSVIDISGQEVIHLKNPKKTTKINLSEFPTGIYFVKIIYDGQPNMFKIEKR